MATVLWVSGDTSPVLPITLQNADGTAYNLTGCTVRFRIKDPDTQLETNSNSTNTCSVVSSTAGTITYAWNALDTPDPKAYTADVEITLANLKVATPFEQVVIATREKN